MKTKCDFCKTEYTIDKIPATPVRCAVCGHTWTIQTPVRRNSFLIFIASLCALLAAIVFTIAVISEYNVVKQKSRPLIATITATDIIQDADGNPQFKVYGTVRNQSGEIYGMPDLIIFMHDAKGNVIGEQKFPPSATLIDSGSLVTFTHTLSGGTAGIKKISAKLVGMK